MAKRKKGNEPESIDTMEKIARLLAFIVIKDLKIDDAALKLAAAGFDPKQIGQMLGVNENYIHVLKTRLRKKKSTRAP